MRRKFLRFVLLMLIGLFVAVRQSLFAQEVIVNIQHPPFNQLAIEDLWKITLTNVSTATYAVNLKATLSENEAGLIAIGTSTTFELPPGPRVFTGADYNQFNPSIEYVNPDPKYQESIVRTGGLPSGEYQICVSVNQASNQEELGRQCIEQSVLMVSPPILISPEDGGEVSSANPSFLWTPVSGVTGVQYKFKLSEIFQGQSAYDAIKNNPAVYSVTIPQTSLAYPPTAPKLIEKMNYAWLVQSLDGSGNPIGYNNGFSEVASFSFIGMSIFPAIQVTQNFTHFDVEKSVSAETVQVGDELTYTILIKRTGKSKPDKVEIKDAIPKGTELVKGSVKVEKVNDKGQASELAKNDYDVNEKEGNLVVKIKKYPDNHYIRISFKVKITSVPDNRTVSNKGLKIHVPRFNIPGGAAGPFDYELKQGTETKVEPNIAVTKVANVKVCGPGDYLEYTITIENKEDKELEITLYDLIPDNAKFEPPVKLNGKEVPSGVVEGSDLNQYVKYKIKIPAKSKVTVTIRYKVTGFGKVINKVLTNLPVKGVTSDKDVKATSEVESNLETYLKNTYERELENIIKHKSTANSVHNIDDALELIKNKEKVFEKKCNGTTVKIKVRFEGWGATPQKCDDKTKGEADASESWYYEKGVLTYEVKIKIHFDCIMEYKNWRDNKAVFYHELCHIQIQLDNWKDPEWWKDFCKKVNEWAKTEKGNPPNVVQDEAEDHKKIGKDDKDNGWHKDFLEKLKKLKE